MNRGVRKMLEPWAPVNGYDVSQTGGVNPFPTPIGTPEASFSNPNFGSLAQTLQGVRAPAAPEAQRVSTPNPGYAPAPRAPTPVKGDQFLQLLQILGQGASAAAPQTPALQPTLMQALGGRRG